MKILEETNVIEFGKLSLAQNLYHLFESFWQAIGRCYLVNDICYTEEVKTQEECDVKFCRCLRRTFLFVYLEFLFAYAVASIGPQSQDDEED